MIQRKFVFITAMALVILLTAGYFSYVFTSRQDTVKENKSLTAQGKEGTLSLQQNSGNAADNTANISEADSAKDDTRKTEQDQYAAKTEVNTPAKPNAAAAPVYTADASRGGSTLSSDVYLEKGDYGSKVAELQKNLKVLGYFYANTTGYYGSITTEAVTRFQSKHNLKQDGVVHTSTLSLIVKLAKERNAKILSDKTPAAAESTKPAAGQQSGTGDNSYLQPWFGGVDSFFKRGDTATIYDIWSGLSFKIKRTYGYNHADCETLTSEDTKIMKKVYGGQWSWIRHPIIVTVHGKRIAASMAGMPHAGVDSEPANAQVSWRSGDYGAGTNLDTIKGNDMDGHFDVHFLGSKTHGTNRVNEDHQNAVKEAAKWAEEHYR